MISPPGAAMMVVLCVVALSHYWDIFPVRPRAKLQIQEDNEIRNDYDFYRPVSWVETE